MCCGPRVEKHEASSCGYTHQKRRRPTPRGEKPSASWNGTQIGKAQTATTTTTATATPTATTAAPSAQPSEAFRTAYRTPNAATKPGGRTRTLAHCLLLSHSNRRTGKTRGKETTQTPQSLSWNSKGTSLHAHNQRHTHTHTYCTTKPLSHSIGCTVWPIH